MNENQDGFEWSQQPLTVKLRRELVLQKKAALAEWRALSEKSSDPRVAAAFARYKTTHDLIAAVEAQAGTKGDDE